MALAAEVQAVQMQRMVFDELRLPVVQLTVIREDIKACQLCANHAGNMNRTKHIEVRYYIVRERIINGGCWVRLPANWLKRHGQLRQSNTRVTILQVSCTTSGVKVNGQVQLEWSEVDWYNNFGSIKEPLCILGS